MDPIPGWMRRVWNAWDIRVMVLLSLIIQIVLVFLGSRRRRYRGIWIEGIVWSAYLMADAIVLFSLGKLSDVTTHTDSSKGSNVTTKRNSSGGNNDENNALLALWAPLLLLHLGGPDTISAYSIEDAQLWLRQLLGLASHVILVVYILVWCWTGSWLSFFSILVFMAGIIKYGERTWVLWFANNENVRASESIEDHAVALDLIRDIPGVKMIVVSYFWLQSMTPYLANYGGNFKESERVALMCTDFKSEEIFKLIEFVLGFMYDVLYTKAPLIYRKAGAILCTISFACTVTMLLSFLIFAKDEYSKVDVIVTYVLLGGAVVIEIYAVVVAIYSHWGILVMIKHCRKGFVAQLVQWLAPKALTEWKIWSNSIAKMNLINFVFYKERSKPFVVVNKILQIFSLDERLKRYRHRIYVDDFKNLKQMIFDVVERINEKLWEFETFSFRGELSLEWNQCGNDFNWSVEKDFDQSIIAWHLATDICAYFDNIHRSVFTDGQVYIQNEISETLSEYMMYLLLNHPYMLRVKGDNAMLEQTCLHLKKLFKEKPFKKDSKESWDLLKQHEADDDESSAKQRWPPPRSALVLARILAEKLLDEKQYSVKKRWAIISNVWVEMVCHGASQCQANYHAKRLTRGGELLTHVWLLLTFYGLTEKSGLGGSALRKIFIGKSTKATMALDWA